jgi:proteasome lid subunit RPN8/RPN11
MKKKALKIPFALWRRLYSELRRRSKGRRESGAFLLGQSSKVSAFICYDDLDPSALDTGIVIIKGGAFVLLWDYCARHKLKVIGDIHTHPTNSTAQSCSDRSNPAVAQPGHVAVILPNFASRKWPSLRGAGIYEYLGQQEWRDGVVKITIL